MSLEGIALEQPSSVDMNKTPNVTDMSTLWNITENSTLQSEPENCLSATELANLWMNYMGDSADVYIKKHVLQTVQDANIRAIFQHAMELSKSHLKVITELFTEDEYPVPYGFSDLDVKLDAPSLFSDSFWLRYIHHAAIQGLNSYSLAVTTSTRSDIREFYGQCINSTLKLYNRASDFLLVKGLLTIPPKIPAPNKPEYIKKEGFFTGFFGDRRPLNAVEIDHIYFNLIKSMTIKATLLGFSQVAESKQVREFMTKCVTVASKHIETFRSVLHQDDLNSPPSFETDVSNSLVPPFSDRLMMFLAVNMFQYAIAYYGSALSASMRTDLATHYQKAVLDDMGVAKSGADLMIEHQWMEQPPIAADRSDLARI